MLGDDELLLYAASSSTAPLLLSPLTKLRLRRLLDSVSMERIDTGDGFFDREFERTIAKAKAAG
jgi:hypothetical protein